MRAVKSVRRGVDVWMMTDEAQRKRGFILGISLLAIGFILVRTGISLAGGLALLLAGIFTISAVRRHSKAANRKMRKFQNEPNPQSQSPHP
ncbi:MAG TPA: hypothetical protein VKT81_02400 [Bryobacteraceae bacterium]|nr:hypothetical protein [Bryobacteraceae bacterium]